MSNWIETQKKEIKAKSQASGLYTMSINDIYDNPDYEGKWWDITKQTINSAYQSIPNMLPSVVSTAINLSPAGTMSKIGTNIGSTLFSYANETGAFESEFKEICINIFIIIGILNYSFMLKE